MPKKHHKNSQNKENVRRTYEFNWRALVFALSRSPLLPLCLSTQCNVRNVIQSNRLVIVWLYNQCEWLCSVTKLPYTRNMATKINTATIRKLLKMNNFTKAKRVIFDFWEYHVGFRATNQQYQFTMCEANVTRYVVVVAVGMARISLQTHCM